MADVDASTRLDGEVMRVDVDFQNVCRDESCSREDLHPAHAEIPLKGRTPKACPRCLVVLSGPKCDACGWFRLNSVRLSATPWIACNPCIGDVCPWCHGDGYLPRVRSAAIRSLPKVIAAEDQPTTSIRVGRSSPSTLALLRWT